MRVASPFALAFFLVALPGISPSAQTVGDWKVWTHTLDVRMSAVSGTRVVVASAGGVGVLDTATGRSQLHTHLDGLPHPSVLAIAIDHSGTIWATTEASGLARLPSGQSRWETFPSYRSTGWVFGSRCLVAHRGWIVAGGPSGISFFESATGRARDNPARFADLARQTVRHLLVWRDTLWVAFDSAVAIATPRWDSIGRPGHFLTDPTRWTVVTRGIPVRTLWVRPDSTVGWESEASAGLTFQGRAVLAFDGHGPAGRAPGIEMDGIPVAGASAAVHLTGWGSAILVSGPSGGLRRLLSPTSILTDLHPWPSLPFASASHATWTPDGSLLVLGESRLLELDPDRTDWIEPTTAHRFASPGTELLDAARNLDILVSTDNGTVFAGSWGEGLSVGLPDGSWSRWSSANSCLRAVVGPDYTVVRALTVGSRHIWASVFSHPDIVDSSQIARFDLSGTLPPSCWSVPREVISLAEAGDGTLWLGTAPSPGNLSGDLREFDPATGRLTGRLLTSTTGQRVERVLPPESNAPAVPPWPDPVAPSSSTEVRPPIFLTQGDLCRIDQAGNVQRTRCAAATRALPFTALDLVRDAAGRLWVGGEGGLEAWQTTDDSVGLAFLASIAVSDGLPSVHVRHLAIDRSSGRLAVVTDAGVGVLQTPSRRLPASLQSSTSRVWPNPFRIHLHSRLVIDGVPLGAEFILRDAGGLLVVRIPSDDAAGGQMTWSPRAGLLRPGVYTWVIRKGDRTLHGHLLVGH